MLIIPVPIHLIYSKFRAVVFNVSAYQNYWAFRPPTASLSVQWDFTILCCGLFSTVLYKKDNNLNV